MSSAAESIAPLAAPTWVRLLEGACVAFLGAHLLFGFRDTRLDMAIYAVLIALVLGMAARGFLPRAPAPERPAGAWALLGGFTLASLAGMVGYGLTQGVTPTPTFVARTGAVYLIYAYLQQALTQRYLVVRIHSWLGRPAVGRSALAVGLLFGVLHLPWPKLIPPTLVGGAVWSYAFLRGGRVWPLALSHAVLAVAWFGFVSGHDPFTEIFPPLPAP